MTAYLPYLVVGVTAGSIYALAALGLILSYKTSGVFNFAHGAVAAGAAYLFYFLRTQQRLPWPIAAVVVVGVAAPIGGVLMEHLVRGLADVRPVMKIVATVGLMLGIQGLATALYGGSALEFKPFLPTRVLSLGVVNIGVDQLIEVVITAVAAGGLALVFRRSRLGAAMRGVVDDPALLGLTGTSPVKVRRVSWMIGFAFAAASGILIAPTLGLDAELLTLLVVYSYGAAAVGGFSSLPLVYAGGLAVGLLETLSKKFVLGHSSLAGLPSSVPFLVLFAVLLFTPAGRFVEAGGGRRRYTGDGPRTSPAVAAAGTLATCAAVLAVPSVVGARLPVFTNGLTLVIVLLSLGLLVWTSGQVCLCQAVFAAVGAAAFGHLVVDAHVPWVMAFLLAGLAAVPVGAFVAVPAIRLSGIYLALATFGFGLLMQQLVYPSFLMFGSQGEVRVPKPAGFHGDKAFYYLVALAVAGSCLILLTLSRSRLGRVLRAMADSPAGLAAQGASVTTARVLVFCVSAFLAGIAGALVGAAPGVISAVPFGPFDSLTYLTVVVICGTRLLRPAFLGAVLVAVLPVYAPAALNDYRTTAFGILAIVVALASDGGLRDWTRLGRHQNSSQDRLLRSPVRARIEEPGQRGSPALTVTGGALPAGTPSAREPVG